MVPTYVTSIGMNNPLEVKKLFEYSLDSYAGIVKPLYAPILEQFIIQT